MKYSEIIQDILKESADLKAAIADKCGEVIEETGLLAAKVFRAGGKVLLCGNGGSAADAQHIAAELVVRLTAKLDRDALPVMALNTNTSTLTACGNDYGFNRIFSRQVEAFGKKGDLLIGISTSGNSPNVNIALDTAKSRGLHTVGLLGGSGGKMKGLADIDVIVPHNDTARIQEGHITIGHILCEIIERELFS